MLNPNPVFVVGVFRSGTSLLCSLLNQNPKIALMYESDIWNFPRPLLSFRFRRNWAERIEFYNQALSRHRMIKAHNYRDLEKIRTPLDLYRAFGEGKGAAVSGEKSPFYCDRLTQLHNRFPNAYFIIVWRPPVEIFRSVLKAGQTSRFFGKPGMLSRMIYQQEQLIRQTAEMEKKGARIFRVEYADVVDRTEQVCRGASDFLGVPFDPQMLRLNKADLSAIYKAPHHAYLRRGIIERQHYTEELVPNAIIEKLERYRHRWEQMQAGWLKLPAGTAQPKPLPVESAYHTVAGKLWTWYDALVRAGFEFLPLAWLRFYRVLKIWVVNPPSGAPDEKTSLLKDLKIHWQTLLMATVLFAATAAFHRHANPHLMFLLFYSIPCAIVALLVNARWATLFVLASALAGPMVQFEGDTDYQSTLIFIWNFIGRFILLEVFTLTLSRIRQECLHLEYRQNIAAGLVPDSNAQHTLKFSIITPSFRNSDWLKLCIASVADQKGVEVEHIVQDSCSDDGTQDWLPHDRRVKAFIEKDGGMYDAVNRGYRRATGDILAYLNCDEQYLPGALAAVEDFFRHHPQVEVLIAGSIVTDGDGNYVCHRHGMVPDPTHIWFRFPALTSSIFIRRRVIHERGIFFDTKWRDLGDFHWVLELIKQRVPMADDPMFTSVFADTGDNMNLKPNAVREKNETNAMIPAGKRLARPLWILSHRLRRLAHGHFSLGKTRYSIYTKTSPDRRVTIEVPHPTPIWWSRL
jgi:glycosyltransferase involved in cell wall biosynthesis